MSANDGRPELVYVGDPLCSWCWGFAPSLARLRDKHPEAFRYRLIVGGLRTGEGALALNGGLREYLSRAWREVEARSGQPFDFAALETASFVYDTEPACRAVVTARKTDPERVFDYNEALQEAFYAGGLDPTARESFLRIAREQGFDPDGFAERLDSEEVDAETTRDFETSRAMGVMGFPATLLRSGDRIRLVAGGFVPPDELLERVRPFL